MDAITMTVKELAEYITISKAMVYKLVREKRIPCIHIGERIVFRKSAVDDWLEKQEVSP